VSSGNTGSGWLKPEGLDIKQSSSNSVKYKVYTYPTPAAGDWIVKSPIIETTINFG
jgi:hypothetical protein